MRTHSLAVFEVAIFQRRNDENTKKAFFDGAVAHICIIDSMLKSKQIGATLKLAVRACKYFEWIFFTLKSSVVKLTESRMG